MKQYMMFDEKYKNRFLKMNFGEDFSVRRSISFAVQNRPLTNLIFDETICNKHVVVDIENCTEVEIDAVFLKSVVGSKLVINVGKNSGINVVFCEISHLEVELDIEINLLASTTFADVNLVSIATETSSKTFNIRINHLAERTSSNIDLKGISKDSSVIRFYPSSHIATKTPFCSAMQENRIVSLNDDSHGIIKPMLVINNNEVKAKHSAALGSVKDDEIFYLLSRGINESVARYLIVKGLVAGTINKLPEIEEKHKFNIVFERGISYVRR